MRFHWLLPSVKGIPVLMYHRIWPDLSDGLTLTPEQLRAQWTWLRNEGWTCLSIQQFLDIAAGKMPAPARAFLLSFDDGYQNNLTYVYPLLQEFDWQATIFIIAGTLDGTYLSPGEGPDKKLTVDELRSMDAKHVQLGLHGYHHENFKETPVQQLRGAMQQSIQVFERAGLAYRKVLAYPYGARPKEAAALREMKQMLQDCGVTAAFRIGNKPSAMPAKDKYELMRIDIRGEDSLGDFKIKLKKGKLKPF